MLELFLMSLKVLVIGLGAAFIGLTILIVFLSLMRRILTNEESNAKEQHSDTDQALKGIEKVEQSRQSKEDLPDEDEQLIAVISAAVAAALNRSTHDIIVRSVRRIETHSPVWNRTGRQEQIRTRL